MKLPLPWAKNKNKSSKKRTPTLMQGQDDYVFRRSRTITGTKAAAVSASAPKRGQFKTDRLKLMELRERRRKIMRFLGGALVAAACMAFLIVNFIASPEVTFPQQGVNTPMAGDYRQSITNYLNNHPFERFSFLLQPQDLATAVMHDQPQVQSITFLRDWYGGNASFSIALRTPLLVWKTANKKFYVDSSGIAFTYNHFAEPALEVTDQSGLPPDQSGAVASSRFIRFLGTLVGAVNTYGKGTVNSIIIPAATREVIVKLQGREYQIKTNTDRDPLQQAEDIASTLKYLDSHGIQPQYIDVRIAHKAYYK